MVLNSRNKTALLLAALLLVLGVGLAVPPAARAQGEVTLEALTVRVWPEYDRPEALVFLIGQVGADVALPAELRLPLPPGVTVNAVAYADDTTGDLFTASSAQDGATLSLTIPSRTFWVEFYDPALALDGETRRYELALTMPYDVAALVWEVETPYAARGLAVEPSEGGTATTDDNGLPAFSVPVGSFTAGQTASLRVTYTKPDPTLTADWLASAVPAEAGAASAAAPPVAASTTRNQPSTLLVVGLLAGGLALVGGGVWWYVRQVQGPARPRTAAASRGGKRFCTQCGQSIAPGDRFCRHCGAKLRG